MEPSSVRTNTSVHLPQWPHKYLNKEIALVQPLSSTQSAPTLITTRDGELFLSQNHVNTLIRHTWNLYSDTIPEMWAFARPKLFHCSLLPMITDLLVWINDENCFIPVKLTLSQDRVFVNAQLVRSFRIIANELHVTIRFRHTEHTYLFTTSMTAPQTRALLQEASNLYFYANPEADKSFPFAKGFSKPSIPTDMNHDSWALKQEWQTIQIRRALTDPRTVYAPAKMQLETLLTKSLFRNG